MRKSPKTVLITFAGRRDRMALLKRYAEAAFQRGLIDEWHVWNFVRTTEDAHWIDQSFPVLRYTGDDRTYRQTAVCIPAVAKHVVRLDLRAGSNAHLALTDAAGGPTYEIILGGWGNSMTALRVWPAGVPIDHGLPRIEPAVTCPTPALLSARAWRRVELHLDRSSGRLSIGIVVDGRTVLTFNSTEECALRALRLAVMTGYGSEADWSFIDEPADPAGVFHATPVRGVQMWNPVYQYYAARAADYAETVFLKCDDDIVYIDLERLAEFIHFRRKHPDYFLVSANVVNNAICAHLQQAHGLISSDVGFLEMPPGGLRGSLWESGAKAERLHRCFLRDPAGFTAAAAKHIFQFSGRLSVNFISWLGPDLKWFDTRFTDDEHDLTVTLPRYIERPNAIYFPFVVSHLSFRDQDKQMDVAGICAAYQKLADQALSVPRFGLQDVRRSDMSSHPFAQLEQIA